MWCLVCTLFFIHQALASMSGVSRTDIPVRFPIYRSDYQPLRKRDGEKEILGLGDFFDVSYTVLMGLGGGLIPLVIDSGSSDLWVISDSCATEPCLETDIPLYSPNAFEPTGLIAQLLYGDSFTGTHAFGPVGKDDLSFAGMTVSDQLFAAVNDTNTTVLQTGAAGILGLGFPVNSQIWFKNFEHDHPVESPQRRSPNFQSRFPQLGRFRGEYSNNGSNNEGNSTHNPRSLRPRDEPLSSNSSWTSVILDSFSQNGPPLTRYIAQLGLEPRFTVSLQRDTVDLGGNAGMLTIGELPDGIEEKDLTWVPVRLYSPAEGGLLPPPESPNETYPLTWEAPIDAVFLNGVKLPRSNLTSPSLSDSALFDTGNNLIRGPSDVVDFIRSMLQNEREGDDSRSYPCTQPNILTFQIGGKMFPIDPKDLGNQLFEDSVEDCVPNLAVTDTPVEGEGFLYSWNLGTPFLKSVLASFHYGNISFPSQDPPRIGFLSTVPDNLEDRYKEAVQKAATENGGNFPAIAEPAPTSLPSFSLNSAGIQKAVPTSTGVDDANRHHDANGAIPGLGLGPIKRPFSRVQKVVGTALITGGILLV
ncbi:hypothetical protein VKT23_015969 [Stygiomarasmius scandens]|uniref:Peptidase A1 domain-containing protein n=1 Tax=Marasmiellus scandens TaxID=2682957 RepID=A0ABR1IYX0_9AGAR